MPTLWNAVPIINQDQSFMFTLTAPHCIGYLAIKADAHAPYVSMALKAMPLIAPKYGEATSQLDESLGKLSMCLEATPDVASTARSIANK